MTRVVNLVKALLLLAAFPLLLLATFWISLVIVGAVAALLAYAADTTLTIPIPLYWSDILPQVIWQRLDLLQPLYQRPTLVLPAPPAQLWAQFVPLAHAATNAAAPYILGLGALWLLWGFRYQGRLVAMLADSRGISYNECPPLYDALERVCQRAGTPMPRLYLVRDMSMNAFASGLGTSTYAITITAGLLATLDREEVEAVLAHELSHIRNQDVRLLAIATVMVGFFSWLASIMWTAVVHTLMGYHSRYAVNVLLLPVLLAVALPVIVGAFLSALIKLLLLREREMGADAGAVKLTSASAMASALAIIATTRQGMHLPAALRDMVIYTPQKKRGWLGRSFIGRVWQRIWSTHPSFEQRLAALAAQGAKPRARGPGLIRVEIENPAR